MNHGSSLSAKSRSPEHGREPACFGCDDHNDAGKRPHGQDPRKRAFPIRFLRRQPSLSVDGALDERLDRRNVAREGNLMARSKRQRSGFSLLEVVVSLAILAMIMTPVVALLRSSQQVWDDRESDVAVLDGAHAAVRHVVRTTRGARRVESMTPETELAGRLVVRMPDNSRLSWTRRNNEIYFSDGGPESLLARNILGLWFVGYRDDAVTPTTTVAEMQFIEVFARVRLDRQGSPTRTISSKVWLRAY